MRFEVLLALVLLLAHSALPILLAAFSVLPQLIAFLQHSFEPFDGLSRDFLDLLLQLDDLPLSLAEHPFQLSQLALQLGFLLFDQDLHLFRPLHLFSQIVELLASLSILLRQHQHLLLVLRRLLRSDVIRLAELLVLSRSVQ